jgi:hypothetical protein
MPQVQSQKDEIIQEKDRQLAEKDKALQEAQEKSQQVRGGFGNALWSILLESSGLPLCFADTTAVPFL